jgi:hypothetical protein
MDRDYEPLILPNIEKGSWIQFTDLEKDRIYLKENSTEDLPYTTDGLYKIKTHGNIPIARLIKDCKQLRKSIFKIESGDHHFYGNSIIKGCSNLKEFISTGSCQVYNAGSMFENCTSLGIVDIQTMSFFECHFMSYMFYNCKKLKEIKFPTNFGRQIGNLHSMFYGCNSLKDIDMEGFRPTLSNCNIEDIRKYCPARIRINKTLRKWSPFKDNLDFYTQSVNDWIQSIS